MAHVDTMNSSNENPRQVTPKLAVVELRAENSENLFGTEVERPRLSWRIASDGRGILQTSYRIRAAASAAALNTGGRFLWDSGRVESGNSLDVPYEGAPLNAMQRVWWDVEIQDKLGLYRERRGNVTH